MLTLSSVVHAKAVARLFVAKPESLDEGWLYTGMVGGLTLSTETNMQMNCYHLIRLIDLDGWTPVRCEPTAPIIASFVALYSLEALE